VDSFLETCYRAFRVHMNSLAQEPHGLDSIAPAWHTCCLLAILAVFSVLSAYLRMGSAAPRVSHLLLFPVVMAFEWTTFFFALWRSNRAFADYLARAVRNSRALLLDVPIALLLSAISFLLEPAMARILGQTGWASLGGMYPRNALETVLWIAMALSAGVCEEAIFRGYLQQQFSAWTGRVSVGVLVQAVCFGLAHAYQARKNIALIFVLGCIFGIFAVWRKGLRANMIAHALVDVLSAF
jgi:uncharacterized protein